MVALSERIDYDGTRSEEIEHAWIELVQLQIGLSSGALSQDEYRRAAARVRRRYGLRGWGDTHRE